MHALTLVLDNVRSAHNVGAIFRTADAMGVSEIVLGGYTPCPLDRFGREQKEIAKTALGAQNTMLWRKSANVESTLEDFKDSGYILVALEQGSEAQNIITYGTPRQTVLVVGNEVDGVSKDALAMCDVMLHIPMLGTKESLNVSVATGIALFALRHGTGKTHTSISS